MKISFFVFGCIAVCTASPSIVDEWASFKTQHGKSYKSQSEEHFRLGIYLKNKQLINEHNEKFSAGLVSYDLKMNHFGDKLPEEISAEVNGFNSSGKLTQRKTSASFLSPENLVLPPSLDWREKGAVTPVKDQGKCGSCWAFSTTGSLEGQLFMKKGKLVSLSEQNLVDCASDYGNEGCNGGIMDRAFKYIEDNGGIDSEESYPYEGINDKCRFQKSQVAASVTGIVDIPPGDEEALQKALAAVGPISVAVNAGLHSFSFYSKGVYNDAKCTADLDHGVLLVGYGSEDGQDYWLVKNSWNSNWGENGYIKIARNQGNLCGIASMASYPLV